jgi:hypothetical protein
MIAAFSAAELMMQCSSVVIADRRSVIRVLRRSCAYLIQHVYTKIGVSTRATGALWAMQHAVVS